MNTHHDRTGFAGYRAGRQPADQHLRMSDADREQAAAELGEHYAQGRLTTDEHSERLDRIWAARTRGELGPIFSDLPSGVGRPAAPPSTRTRRPFRGLPTPLVALLAVMVAGLAAMTLLAAWPVLLVVAGIWFLAARHGGCRSR